MFNTQLDKLIARRTSLTQAQAREARTALFQVINDALASGEDVSILGFGKFHTAIRKGRTLPHSAISGGPVTMPDSRIPKFHAFSGLRDSVRSATADAPGAAE